MSSQPPTGPPSGPVPRPSGPAPGPPPPGPGPSGGRSRRTLALIVGGAAAVLALVVVLVLSLGGDGDDGGGGSGSPTPVDTKAAEADAHAVATRVALAPPDWGAGFTQHDPYEVDPAPESLVREDCEFASRPSRAGTLSSLQRNVYQTSSGIAGTSEVKVFVDEATAKRYLADARDNIHRCPEQHRAKERWNGVREATPPQVTGFDELVSEEGHQVVTANGGKVDDLYVIATGRDGKSVLSAYVVGSSKLDPQIHKYASDSLQKMQQRLVQQPEAAATGG
ncbi:hypothetical protein ABZ729_19435 [Streptomyces sp. NPDC006678]|uniref:hypothetical protein n=1 Tax=Streptomyces sp. NPDC006678 TaxID=3157185 RepID=UPI0033EAA0DC